MPSALVVSRFFVFTYTYMALGLAVTAAVAWGLANQAPELILNLSPIARIVLFVVSIAMVIGINVAAPKVNHNVGIALFLLYSALMGWLISYIFILYTPVSIVGTFLVTSLMYGAMAVYGVTTKRDLSSWGSILFMGLIGIIIASIVNMFWANSVLYWAVTYIGVIVFTGLAAYDNQQLKKMALAIGHDTRLAPRYAVVGALSIYLTFINLFLFLLRILGNRD